CAFAGTALRRSAHTTGRLMLRSMAAILDEFGRERSGFEGVFTDLTKKEAGHRRQDTGDRRLRGNRGQRERAAALVAPPRVRDGVGEGVDEARVDVDGL